MAPRAWFPSATRRYARRLPRRPSRRRPAWSSLPRSMTGRSTRTRDTGDESDSSRAPCLPRRSSVGPCLWRHRPRRLFDAGLGLRLLLRPAVRGGRRRPRSARMQPARIGLPCRHPVRSEVLRDSAGLWPARTGGRGSIAISVGRPARRLSNLFAKWRIVEVYDRRDELRLGGAAIRRRS
jgi:hypothetical protein